MSHPNIAITPSYDKGFIRMRPTYFNAVWESGGIPSYVAYTTDAQKIAEYIDTFDGFLFAGGVDVHPKHYGEEIKFDSVEVLEARDDFELALYAAAIKSGKPILGICRGIQLINVAAGGSLYQHIDGHSQDESGKIRTQKVLIENNTPLSCMANGAESVMVNTFHHQAVKQIADGFLPMAWSEEGICEAIYNPEHKFLMGVQWHPEFFYDNDVTAANLFKEFIAATK